MNTTLYLIISSVFAKNTTIQRVHRLSDKIRQCLEKKEYCSAAFLDVSQAFDKVRHPRLLFKIKHSLPHNYFLLIKSYLENRHFRIKYHGVYTNLHRTLSGVPQGSVLGPLLYLIYTSDIPENPNLFVSNFADDTALITSHSDPTIASQALQDGLNRLSTWLKTWRVKVNESKSVHVTFTTRSANCPSV